MLTPTLPIHGSDSAAPANAVVRVTNLDSNTAPVAANATASGAFDLNIPGVPGNELRFQAQVMDQRSAPIDFIFTDSTPPTLVRSPRHTCVMLNPGFELAFEATGSQALTLLDACPGALSVSNPRQRRALPAFSFSGALPLELAPNETGTLNVGFSGSAGAGLEDTLFLDLTATGSVLRYPITLAAP